MFIDTPRGRAALTLLLLPFLAACAQPAAKPLATAPASIPLVNPELKMMYSAIEDGEETIPAVPDAFLSERNKRQLVDYWTKEKSGTIVVDPFARFLYLVMEDNTAMRYGVAVGDQGRGFSGTGNIPFKRAWPRWTPTPNMLKRDPELYAPHRGGMEGGIDNPLGARALYMFKDGRDTLYRIHGTNNPGSIGRAQSAGCIRLFNQDIVDLHDRVASGAKVVVLSEEESGLGTVPLAGQAIANSDTILNSGENT